MHNLRAIAMMILAMASFSLGDMGIKYLTPTMPAGEIVCLMGLCGTLFFAIWTRREGHALWSPIFGHRSVLTRYGAEMTAGVGMSMALTLTPLSLVSSILQATPLAVTLGAILIFGEQVGWRRWTAILGGFAGVLLILRPGTSGFDANGLFAVLAMAGLAVRDLATRAVPPGLSNLQLATNGFSAFVPTGLLVLAFQGGAVWPNAEQILGVLGITGVSILGYYCITAAMRIGEISPVQPFRYSRLIFGMTLGIMFFGERPDVWMLVGATLIVASGLFAMLRERRAMQDTG